MASLLPGYAYDIFISYRQKDNKSDHWVTEFVNALRSELDSTLKDEISIYFDENPHDGLLEMHSVDQSLEGKLKCLIFIPIISQTYCDPKSFAWQHEFCVFNKLAKEDGLGRDIKLGNGNVSSRILPVKIHDLDVSDTAMIEKEIGGVLRAIEFIYNEPGVNRPLKADDKKEENRLKTSYRNQVNKTANAVKEILNALQQRQPPTFEKGTKRRPEGRLPLKKIAAAVIAALVTGIAIFYFKFFPAQAPPVSENTILILPFRSDPNDTSQSYFADGITADIITEIGKARNLSPLSWHTSFEYANTKKSLQEVAEETKARYVLSGNIQKVANTLRFYVELADPYNNKTLWISRYDKPLTAILDVQKEIAFNVAEALEVRLSDSEKKNIGRYKTRSFEAYDLFLQAEVISRTLKLDLTLYEKGQALLEKAIAIDPDFAEAYVLYAHNLIEITTYGDLDAIEMSKKADAALAKSIALYPELPDNYIVLGAVNFFLKWDLNEALKNFEKGWAMTNKGNNAIYHCLCAYSQYKLAKGNFGEVIGFVDSVQKRDPRYPTAEIEKFSAYYGLQDSVGMNAIRNAERPEFLIPIYDYYLGHYLKSSREFDPANPFLILGHLGAAYYKAGFKTKSDSMLSTVLRLPDESPHKDIQLALIYGARGDRKKTLEWYKKAFEGHDYIILYTRVISDFKIILEAPEVKTIFEKIGL